MNLNQAWIAAESAQLPREWDEQNTDISASIVALVAISPIDTTQIIFPEFFNVFKSREPFNWNPPIRAFM